jgi:hypothetical protein
MGQESYFLNIAKGAEMLRGNPSQERNECMYSRTRMGSLSNWVDVWTGPEWLGMGCAELGWWSLDGGNASFRLELREQRP